MPTESPDVSSQSDKGVDLVSQYESEQQQSQPDLVSQFEAESAAPKPATARPDFTQDALSGKLAPPAGRPHDPQEDVPVQYNAKTGLPYRPALVPEAEGWNDPLIHIAAGAEPIATGWSRMSENQPAHPSGPNRFATEAPPILAPAQQAEEEKKRRQRSLGAAEVLEGTGQLGTVAVPASIATAPIKTALGFGAGYLASEGAGTIAHDKVSPEDEQLIRNLAFFLPSAAGMAAGLKTGTIETPQGKFSGASVFGGKARAGVGVTPDVVTARVKVGGTQFEANFPRGGATPEPSDAAKMLGEFQQASGATPTPAPPTPPPQYQGPDHLTPEVAKAVTTNIMKAPPADRPKLMLEAHQNMVRWMINKGTFTGPDGKIYSVDNEGQAKKLASTFINDQVDAADKAAEEAAKAPQPATTPAKAPINKPKAATQQPVTTSPANQPAAQPLPTTAPVSGKAGGAHPMGKGMTQDSPAVDKVAQEATLTPGQEPLVMVKEEKPADVVKLAQPPEPVKPEELAAIGTKDEESGRTILQPSDDVLQNERMAAEAAPELATKLSEISGNVDGARFDRMRPQKNLERITEKEDADKPPSTIADYSAAQIAADTPEAKDQLIAELHKNFKVLSVEDKFTTGDKDLQNYPSVKVQVQLSNGHTSEVQIVPTEMQEVADHAHHFYSEGRKADAAGDTAKRDEMWAQSEKINTDALDRAKESWKAKGWNPDGIASSGESAPDLVSQFEGEPKHDFASTQINIDPKSELGKAHAAAVANIPREHVGKEGTENTPHVTVRYGLKDDSPESIQRIRDAAAKIAPFEVPVGKTDIFPATEHSSFDHPAIARLESTPELKALRSAVEAAGGFAEDNFPEYKPHVTLGYIKPEFAQQYKGGNHLEGHKVPVKEITVSKRDGTKEAIPLGGKAEESATPARQAVRARAQRSAEEAEKKLLATDAGKRYAQQVRDELMSGVSEDDLSTPHKMADRDVLNFEKQEIIIRAVKRELGAGEKKPVPDVGNDQPSKKPGFGESPYVEPTAPPSDHLEESNWDVGRERINGKDHWVIYNAKGQRLGISEKSEAAALDKARKTAALGPEAHTHVFPASNPTVIEEKQPLQSSSQPPARKPDEFPRGKQIDGVDGAETQLSTDNDKLPSRYRLVELSDLTPSHHGTHFGPNLDYPEGVQERTYHSDKQSQARVIEQDRDFDPNFLVNTNPDAVNGPPVVTPDGYALGGNSRVMTLQRVYGRKGAQGYIDAIKQQAGAFGLDAAAIDKMKQPVLVREIASPKTIEEGARLARELNRNKTGALTSSQKAVSLARLVSEDTLKAIQDMAAQIGPDATLNDIMREKGAEVIQRLVEDGVITDRERPQYLDKGVISEDAKGLVSKVLRGTYITNPELFDRVPARVLNKLDRSLVDLGYLKTRDDGYNILPIVEEALTAHAEMAERGLSVNDYLKQGGLFGSGLSPDVDAMVQMLGQNTGVIRKAIQQFTQDAMADKQFSGQGLLDIGGPERSPLDAYGAAFHVDPATLKGPARPKPEKAQGPTERRQDVSLRKRVDQMTPEEKDRELEELRKERLTSDITGLPGKKAFREDAATMAESHPHVGFADIDDFKEFNTILGEDPVDEKVLPMVGEAFQRAASKEPAGSIKVYHRSGDEFWFRAKDKAAITRVVNRVNDELKTAVFTAEAPDGTIHEKVGAGLSHGTGTDTKSAEHDAKVGQHAGSKQQRKAAGLRSGSRDLPGRVGEEPATGQQAGEREVPERINDQQRPVRRETEDVSQPPSGSNSLVEAIYQKLKDGQSLGNVTELNELAEQHFGSSRVSGNWTPKDAYDAMEAGVNKYLLHRGKDLMAMDAHEGLAELRQLMTRLTSQGIRTTEQIQNQQFSTPPTLSYVAAKVAGLTPNDVVLEPSAGNGGLAVWPKAIGAQVHVNEIAPRRQEMLKAAGFDQPTAHDGEIINSLLDSSVQPTAVIMNPPFSSSTLKSHELTKNNNQFGFNHVDSALQRLAPGGRLVAILGGGRPLDGGDGGASLTKGSSARWFERIGEKYNIRANVRIDGKEYQKYGTTFATRLIVIDKNGPTPSRVAAGKVKTWDSVARGNVKTLEEAYNVLKDVAESRPEPEVPALNSGKEGDGNSIAGTGVGTPSGAVSTRRPGELSGNAKAGAEVQPSGGPAKPDRSSGTPQTSTGNQPVRGEQPGVQPSKGPGENGSIEGGRGTSENGDVKRPLSAPSQPAEPGSFRLERNEPRKGGEERDSSAYVTYQPTLKGPKHPANIVETATMATVPLPAITYQPSIPDSVLEGGKLSAIQLEPVALAGMQNDIVLPSGHRASVLVGDGTGVGKGRTSAAILLDNWNKGRRRLVWVSEKWDLMDAARNDLIGIGATTLAKEMKGFNKYSATDTIDHRGILFTTYALLRSADKKGNKRAHQLQHWLRGSDEGDGGHILFDEAHNLKNAVASKGSEASQIGETVKKLLADNPKLRTTSLSATAASDVMNLGYLDRLGLWGPGTPFPNGFQQFANEISGGGLSAMEMVARELKAQGKYVARTLSFKGVTYGQKEHVLTPEQKEVYRSAVKAWQTVSQRAEDTIANTTNGGKGAKARFSSLFYSAQQRFFNVLLTTLKIPTAVEDANQALADGKSVIISLVNTNEAAQNREKNKAKDMGDSDELPDFDFGPGEMLMDMVREHYPVNQFVDDVTPEGKPIKVPAYTTDSDGRKIPLINPQAVKERDSLLAELKRNLNMPANPLDILVESLGGHSKVAEITGRKERYDEGSGRFVPRGDPNVSRDQINLHEMRNFQGGKKRVAILSSAGGTGISLHAGNDVANKQKRYHITLQVGWSADKAMQMLGRSHRTNQVQAPEYTLLTSNMGGEKRFISSLSRRMGSLEALSRGQTKTTENTEMMDKVNFETAQGESATNSFYDSMLRNVEVPGALDSEGNTMHGMQVLTDLSVLKQDPQSGAMTVPKEDRTNVTRLLNRLLALDPDVQNAVYDYFYDIFQAKVEQAVENGTLDTGVKTLPGDDFHVREQRELASDPQTGAKTIYYPVEAKVRNERVSLDDLDRLMKSYKSSNPVLMKNDKGEIALAMEAKPIVHASGHTEPASYIVKPGNGRPQKVSNSTLHGYEDIRAAAQRAVNKAKEELDLRMKVMYQAKAAARQYNNAPWAAGRVESAQKEVEAAEQAVKEAQQANKEPEKAAREAWLKKYEDAPTHTTQEHHLIGGAVLRWWNAIRESSTYGLKIYTLTDSKSGQRVVGVEIPGNKINTLLNRIGGGKSTVSASQIIADVLHNNLDYTLEKGGRITRGRLAGTPVVRFMPASEAAAKTLVSMGVIHEKGALPIYYLPSDTSKAHTILDKVLEQFPVKEPDTAEAQSPENSETRKDSAAKPFVSRRSGRGSESGAAPLDLAAGVAGGAAKVAKSFFENDLRPLTQGVSGGLKEAIKAGLNIIAPRMTAPKQSLDVAMKMKGQREEELFRFDRTMDALHTMFDKMAKEDRVRFIDDIMRGRNQASPELDEIAQALRQVQERFRAMEKVFRPDLTAVENYFHLKWRKLPSGVDAEGNIIEGTGGRETYAGPSRRPLQGGKSFMKRKSLPDASTGIERGGELISTNPIDLLRHRVEESLKFTTARKAWEEHKSTPYMVDDSGRILHIVQFFKKEKEGLARSLGYDKLNDPIAKVMFPAGSGEGMIEPGEYWVEANTARLYNNFLSRDLIRENAAGRGLVAIKNGVTAWKLGFSPFHAITESMLAMGSEIGRGYEHAFNEGIRQGSPTEFARGLGIAAKGFAAPVTAAREGGKAVRYVTDPDTFLQTSGGKDWLKKYPEANELITDLFTGGAKLAMHEDFRINALQGLRQEIADNNYIGAAFRSPMALNQALQHPLFEVYIPRLKVGMFLREYSQALADRADELAAGKLNRAQLSREIWDGVEHRFGELNWDNFFWNRTFKTGNQLLWRAFSWTYGNAKFVQKAATGQAQEIIEAAKYWKDAYDHTAGTGEQKAKPGTTAIPRLDRNMAKILGMLTVGIAVHTALQYYFTHEMPKDHKDLIAPRDGTKDKNGQDNRWSAPLVPFKDIESAANNPGHYVKGKFADIWTAVPEAVNNRDFNNHLISHPSDPWWEQMYDRALHVVGAPIGYSKFRQEKKQGSDTETALLGTLGISRAGKNTTATPAEKKMREIRASHFGPMTDEELEAREQKDARIAAGNLTRHERQKQRNEARKNMFEKDMEQFSYDQVKQVYDLADPDEQAMMRRLLLQKRFARTR